MLVDYYRGLVERSESYELDGDSKSSDDEEIDEDDEEYDLAEAETEAETNTQWKAWMEDVSTRRSGGDDPRQEEEVERG